MTRHLQIRSPNCDWDDWSGSCLPHHAQNISARLPTDAGSEIATSPPPRAGIILPSCTPRGGVNTNWSGNSCAVHPTERCAPRAGVGVDWLSTKCAVLHEGTAEAASAAQPSGAGTQLIALALQPVDEAAHSPVVAELGWAVAVVLALGLGLARRPALRAIARVMDWSKHGDRLRIAPPAAAIAGAGEMSPPHAVRREIEAPPRAPALVRDGRVNELLEQLGSDEETAQRALLQLYARGGWLKWEDILPCELPDEVRTRLVKVCRMINGTLTLGEARAALAQARYMLSAHHIACEPIAA